MADDNFKPKDLEKENLNLSKENEGLVEQNEKLERKLDENKWKSWFWFSLIFNGLSVIVVALVLNTTTWKSPDYVTEIEKEQGTILPILQALKADSCMEKRLRGLPLDSYDDCPDSSAVTSPAQKEVQVQAESAPTSDMKFFAPEAVENLRLAKIKQKEDDDRRLAEVEQAAAEADASESEDESEEEPAEEPEVIPTPNPSVPTP